MGLWSGSARRVPPAFGRRCRLALGTLAAGLVLVSAACAGVAAQTQPTPSMTSSLSVYMSEGALNAADGATRWTTDLGVTPPASASGVLYAHVLSPDRRSELVRAVRAQDGKVLWQYTTSDSSIENVTLAGDHVLVATAQGNGSVMLTVTLLALRTSDGGVLWRSAPMSAAAAPQLDNPAPVISTLAVTSDRIVAMVADSKGKSYVVAWSLADGGLAWRMPLPETGEPNGYAGPFGTANVTGATVTLVYGRQATNSILAVDAATGKQLWSESGFGWVDLAAPTVVVLSNGLTGTIIGLRPQDGATVWERPLGAVLASNTLSLSLDAKSDTALFYTRYDQCQPSTESTIQLACHLHLYAVRTADGNVLWERSMGLSNPDLAFKLLYGNDTLYYNSFYYDSAGAHNVLMALRGSDGSIRWTHDSGGLFAQAVAADGMIFAQTCSGPPGQLTCTELIEALSDRDGSQVWRWTFSPPNSTLLFARWIEVA